MLTDRLLVQTQSVTKRFVGFYDVVVIAVVIAVVCVVVVAAAVIAVVIVVVAAVISVLIAVVISVVIAVCTLIVLVSNLLLKVQYSKNDFVRVHAFGQ